MAKQNASSGSGWDPVLIIFQIVSLQALHYLTLAVLVSSFLALFAEPSSLEFEGGAANVGMLMDWRQMSGRPTSAESLADTLNAVWSGGKQVGTITSPLAMSEDDSGWHIDPRRGWIIAVCWLAACGADIFYLYTFIRRPRLVLDFALTLLFNHLVFTTYYSSALPTSLFFWIIMAASAALMVIVAEQMCVQREMREGLTVNTGTGGRNGLEGDEIEMGSLLRED